MEPEKIQRINELKKISRERDLTALEKEEQSSLRQEYITGFRANMQQILENVRIQETDGSVRPLQKKEDKR